MTSFFSKKRQGVVLEPSCASPVQFNASISGKLLYTNIGFMTYLKLLFPILNIYPFKNTYTVPNTVLQQNMQQWIISIFRCLEHVISSCTTLLVGNTAFMPSLTINPCIFKTSIETSIFLHDSFMFDQTQHSPSVKSHYTHRQNWSADPVGYILLLMLLQEEITERFPLHEDE